MYLVFDTETTGQAIDFQASTADSNNWPRLVELAWAVYDVDGLLVRKQQCLISPVGYLIPADATLIHGITTEVALAEGIPLHRALGRFATDVLKCSFVVARNAEFDCKILKAEIHRLGRPDFLSRAPVVCTMQMGTNASGDKWPRLLELHQRLFGIGFENQHRAGGDVAACARCFFEMLRQGQPLAGYRWVGYSDDFKLVNLAITQTATSQAAAPAESVGLDKPSVRVAVAHLFATGTYHATGKHGLLHVALLPLVAGGEVQEWFVRKPRKSVGIPSAVRESCRITDEAANIAPEWTEQLPHVQAAFAQFDAVLIIDRTGQPSPERTWFEQVVLAGLARPVCVALDELAAFFLPNEAFDDADDLKEALLLAGTADAKRLRDECRYTDKGPQLPFLLHAMRREVRRTLASVLRPEPLSGNPADNAPQWAPAYALLQQALAGAGRPRELRGFRLLAQLARQPTCCDAPAAAGLQLEGPLPPLPDLTTLVQPTAMDPLAVQQLLKQWLRPLVSKPPPPPDPTRQKSPAGRVQPAEVAAAFAEVTKREKARQRSWHLRPAQEKYARFVTDAFNNNGAYALEAGTGTGKTFGYLVPALEYLRQQPSGLVVVATSTKNLQDQMMQGELPALCNQLDGGRNDWYQDVRVALFKGKNCYLCADALTEAFERSFAPSAGWPAALAWCYLALRLRDAGGDIENVALSIEKLFDPSRALQNLRVKVSAHEACNHAHKGLRHAFATCVYALHSRRAESANLLIVNHHKLALLSPKILKDRECFCIVDEADRFPDYFRSARKKELHAQRLYQQTLLPLLGKTLEVDSAHYALLDRASQDATASTDGLGFLGKWQERVNTELQARWLHAGFGPYGSPFKPDDVLRLETEAEDELAALWAEAGRHYPLLANASAEPPTLPAHPVADAVLEQYWQLHKEAHKRRSFTRIANELRRLRQLLRRVVRELLAVGQHFLPAGGAPARLPFPERQETHWLDAVEVTTNGQTQRRALAWELHDALLPLHEPLVEAACIVRASSAAMSALLGVGANEDAPGATKIEDKPDSDEQLYGQVKRYTTRIDEAAFVVHELRTHFRRSPNVPVLHRTGTNALGWALIQLPFDLTHRLWQTPPDGGEIPLFTQYKVVVFTSATLYVDGTTDYFRRQLNRAQPFANEQCIEAAFDFMNDEKVVAMTMPYLPRFAHPTYREFDEQAWREQQAQTLLPLLIAPEGRTLVLFTNQKEMNEVFNRLDLRLKEYDIEAIKQAEIGASQWQIRRFRRVQQSVLFGVERMWTGVDFPGKTLVQVILWRLPLPHFSDVLVCHRRQHEGRGFMSDFYHPTARLKIRQGFGRLVRRSGDQGAFVVLDARADPAGPNNSNHLLNELRHVSFTSHADATSLHTQLVNEVLKLPGIALKTNFEDGRGLSVEKLGKIRL